MRTLKEWSRVIVGALSLLLLAAAHAGAGEAPTPAPDVSKPEAGQQTPALAGVASGTMMECPMMAGTGRGMRMGGGGMGGMRMSSMGMPSMDMSGMGMNHASGTTTTLTDIAQNVSLRDILRIVQALAAVQERMLKSLPAARAAEIRPELDQLKLRSGELLTEINGMISTAARGE